MVCLQGTGIFDDDITEELCHQLLPFDLGQAVPAVRVFRADQVEYLYGISVILKVEAQIRVKLGFGIGDDEAFPALHALEYHIPGIGTALHAAAGTEDCHVPVHPCLFREADCFPMEFPQDDTAAF